MGTVKSISSCNLHFEFVLDCIDPDLTHLHRKAGKILTVYLSHTPFFTDWVFITKLLQILVPHLVTCKF